MAKPNRALVILKRPLEADDIDELAEGFTKAARRPDGPLVKLGVEMAVESVVIRRAGAHDLLAARDEPNPTERHRATMRAIASWRAGVLALEAAAKFLAMDGYARVDDAGDSVDMHAMFAAYAARSRAEDMARAAEQNEPKPVTPACESAVSPAIEVAVRTNGEDSTQEEADDILFPRWPQ